MSHPLQSLPVSAIVATRNRPEPLRRAFDSLAAQGVLPCEIVVVDASSDDRTKEVCDEFARRWESQTRFVWVRASEQGAAPQRNAGFALSTQPFVWFFDDDVVLGADSLPRLWTAINSDPALGGVSAMIVNQQYGRPGALTRLVFRLLHGRKEHSYAGRIVGPAVNLLPADEDTLPDVVPVEWLNLGSTMYRRAALPLPPFDSQFTGYSLMEDVALSVRVSRTWRLANARTARIVHDSQPADYKRDPRHRAAMELRNRLYLMAHVLNRRSPLDYCRLLVWEAFQLVSAIREPQARSTLRATVSGKLTALRTTVFPARAL